MYNKKIILSLLASSILVAQEIELEKITVTSATKTPQSIEDVTSNVNVITAKEIEEKRYTTVVQAINSAPGLNFTSNGGLMGQATSVFVRGQDSIRTLVLIDGIRYNDVTGLSGAPFAELMISDIKQIEIIKGAQSGIWGADASAGIINIITKEAKKGLHGSINAEYGSFDTKKYGFSASYKEDNYYIKASSQKIDTDGFTAQAVRNVDIDSYEDDGYENITTNLKFGFNINDKNKVDISHTVIDAENEYDSFGDPNGIRTSKTNDTFSQINFNHVNDYTEVDLYAKLSVFNRDYPDESTTEHDGQTQEYGIKTNTSYNENDFVIVGADYKKFEQRNTINKSYDNKAVFITNTNEFTNTYGKTIVTESLRFDDYNKFDDKTTGKFGLKHFFKDIDSLVISSNVGTSYNVPTIGNLYGQWGANLNLKPESTTSYDLSVAYRDIKVTYFQTSTKDMIAWEGAGYENIAGKSKFKGVEVEYSTDITTDLSLTSNYTWLDARNNDGERLKRRPHHTMKLALDYYGIKNLHVGTYCEYIGERYKNDDDDGVQTGKYVVVNLVSNYTVNKNLTLYAKIDNLFDKYYQVVDGYATAPLSAYIGFNAKF